MSPAVGQRDIIGVALAAWRDAERRQARASGAEAAALTLEVEHQRDEYQRLSTAHMVDSLARLDEAEDRRANATPSTVPFHEAARDTQEIAAEIWESARSSDEDTPKTKANRRKTPSPTAPGVR
jgi:hypothetical protein